MLFSEFEWVFIYVFAFGLSDIFVKKYVKTTFYQVCYYLLLGCIGGFLLLHNCCYLQNPTI